MRRDPVLPGNAFKIAYEIGLHLNRKSCTAWPSQDTICVNTGLSESSVKRAIGLLRRRGYLAVTPGAGRGQSTRYRLLFGERPAETGSEVNPFSVPERGSDRAVKGFKTRREKGSLLNSDLLNHLGDANASPLGEREARARENPGSCARPVGAAQDEGRGRGREGERSTAKSKRAEDGFLELQKIWVRPWCDDDAGQAWLSFDDVVREVDPRVILSAARKWVEAADAPRFLSSLAKWLTTRGWERPPPGRGKARPDKAARPAAPRNGRKVSLVQSALRAIEINAGGW